MKSDRRKRIWKGLGFWGSFFLFVLVGIGVLFWHSYRKSLGPPPTPPGKSPEFDKHLADIDEKWLFVFNDDGRIVVTDIYGRSERELTITGTGASVGMVEPVFGLSSYTG